MVFVLVRWLKEDRVSVIPSSWAVQPNPIPAQSELPVKGLCFWRKKGNKYDTMILKVSGIFFFFETYLSLFFFFFFAKEKKRYFLDTRGG